MGEGSILPLSVCLFLFLGVHTPLSVYRKHFIEIENKHFCLEEEEEEDAGGTRCKFGPKNIGNFLETIFLKKLKNSLENRPIIVKNV